MVKAAGLLGLAVFALCMVVLVLNGLTDDIAPSDVGVVLGAKVERDGRPSPYLAARLDETLILYRKGLFRAVIVSGGVGHAGFDEAKVMRDYLVARGVPATAISVDSHGDTTMATARNGAALMKAHGWRSVLVISQYFHVPRARLAFEKAGAPVIHWAHARYFGWRDVYAVPREVVGYGAYLIG
jgi:vancomycin permeability regulator SanA